MPANGSTATPQFMTHEETMRRITKRGLRVWSNTCDTVMTGACEEPPFALAYRTSNIVRGHVQVGYIQQDSPLSRRHWTETPSSLASLIALHGDLDMLGPQKAIIWRCSTGKEEECRLLGYNNQVRTSQQTHYISATEPNQLMLCKTWGSHSCDNEEYSLLRYKDPVRTSQETHYVSTTELRRLMLCKIWGFHGSDYEECRLLGYKNPVRTSQETHYVWATEPSRLMLCKIWGFHCGDYEEYRHLRYKTPVRTSPETRNVSATELNQLILCKIWGFHGGDYEEWRLLGCYAVLLLLKIDVSEEISASIIRVTRFTELGTTFAVSSNRNTFRRNTMWAVSMSSFSIE
jgi:hypothetical protein